MSEKRVGHKYFWIVRAILVCLFLTVIGGHTAVTQAADSQWQANYWNNRTLTGNPVLSRSESNLNNDWGDGSPDLLLTPGQFSARWTRNVNFSASATYRFTATMDDGMRVWVDNVLIIDSWWDSQVHTMTADIYLNAGDHAIKVEYYEAGGKAVAKLNWAQIGSNGPTPISNWKGEYFNNRYLSGSPSVLRDDSQVNFNWGSGSPGSGLNSDNFSVRWTRTLSFAAGRYRFTATSDDGVRVWVNGQQVINSWAEQQPQTFSGEITLASGSYPVQVEYFESVGGAQIQVNWTQIAATPSTPTPTTPTLPSTGTGTVVSPLLNIRRGPGFQYSVINTLPKGATVQLAGYRTADSHWVMINYSGTQAWVSGKSPYLNTNIPVSNLAVWQGTVPNTGGPTSGTTAVIANAYYVNLRTTPAVGNNVITAVPSGTIVQLLGRNSAGTWAKVQLPNLTTGWMSATYLNSSTPINTLQITN